MEHDVDIDGAVSVALPKGDDEVLLHHVLKRLLKVVSPISDGKLRDGNDTVVLDCEATLADELPLLPL